MSNSKNPRLCTLLSLCVALLIQGCSWLGFNENIPVPIEEEPAMQEEQEPFVQAPKDAETSVPAKSVIEITWQVPTDNVDYYLLHYGSAPDQLDHELKVKVSELEQIDDPVAGKLFRYEFAPEGNLPAVFLSMQAENSSGLSPATPPQKVAP